MHICKGERKKCKQTTHVLDNKCLIPLRAQNKNFSRISLLESD